MTSTANSTAISTDTGSLQNLNDIVIPTEISWWPLATGWYFLLALLLALSVWLVFRGYTHWIKNRYRREALLQLQQLEKGSANAANRDASLRQIPSLLKRTAISVYPREQVASLTGEQWFDFLNASLQNPTFNSENSATLEKIAYSVGSLNTVDAHSAQALINASRYWLQNHRPEQLPGNQG
ncbi:MAG: DUF4381 domain-containing protein [Xanthomonadales bacterium]|nr:DUF4381 domain-containing protein [Xanthomonadales bacterium]